MYPTEHLIVAALPVVGYVLLRNQQLPSLPLLAVVFVGSQFPDLVDKPLAHAFFLIPSGRVFMHSLPFAIPICGAVLAYGWWTRRLRLGGAFVLAYLSHVVADTYPVLRTGQLPPDLLWPFVAPSPRPVVPHWAGPNGINVQLWTLFSVTVLAITLVVVGRDVRTQLRERR